MITPETLVSHIHAALQAAKVAPTWFCYTQAARHGVLQPTVTLEPSPEGIVRAAMAAGGNPTVLGSLDACEMFAQNELARLRQVAVDAVKPRFDARVRGRLVDVSIPSPRSKQ